MMPRPIPISLLSSSSELVAAALGLHFPEEKWPDLERGLASAAPELGHPDGEKLALWLRSASPTRAETEVLASHLTIGETYFFRDPETLQVFETTIVPDLLRAREATGRRIRIWSAGCCTGEEPYTIAMILDRLLPSESGWNVTILATDINPRFLRKAAEGIYSEWSFRAMPPGTRERWFRRKGERRWELDPKIRSRVRFSCVNLATDVFPALVNDTNAMDVIFCRNVLMYFSAERVAEVAQKFHRTLTSGGWLIVSAAETSAATFSLFQGVPHAGGTAYRKRVAGRQDEPEPLLPASPAVALPERPAEIIAPEPVSQPVSDRLSVAPPAPPITAAGEESSHELVEKARRSANEGRLAEAAALCERALAADKMNPARHYLLSAVRREMGELDAAAAALGRALYLDHDFVLAHYGLATIELTRGGQKAARRHFANALAALRSHAGHEILPESEGMTAGRLNEIIESLLASLPGERSPAGGAGRR